MSASAWSTASLAISQLARLASNLVLAKLLAPEDFGVVAIVSSILAGLQMFSDIGIVPSIVRSTRGEESIFLDTAFTLQAARGFALFLIACVAAWPVSLAYGSDLLYLLPVSAVTALLNGLSSSRIAVAARHMDQRRLAFLELASFAIQLCTTLAWAVVDASAWAIVAGWIAGALTKSILSHHCLGHWADRFRLDPSALRELLVFGRWVFVSTCIAFLALQSDRLLLGKLMDLSSLGLYSIALSLIALPRDLVSKLASAIQFAALSRCIRESPEDFEQTLLRSHRVLLTLSLWMIVTISYYSQAFFAVLYDARYQSAPGILKFLAVPVFVNCVSQASAFGLLALGDSRSLARADIARVVTLVPACITGAVHFGLVGFIAGLAVSSLTGYLFQSQSVRSHKVRVLRSDLGFFLLFVTLMGVPLAAGVARGWLGSYRGVDIGTLAVCTVVLVPLSIVACVQIRSLVTQRAARGAGAINA
jgi:O-antigen/teichoic acid export membrane protein